MVNKNQIQQGDVLLERVAKLPYGAKAKEFPNGIILAEGEVTGHHHMIKDAGAKAYELNGVLYVEVKDPVILTHEEHKNLPIPPGIYKVGQVKEYDHLTQVTKQVVD